MSLWNILRSAGFRPSSALRARCLAGGLLCAACAGAGETRAPAAGAPDETATWALTLAEAALRALEHNAAFRVERIRAEIQGTAEAEERAVFDPALSIGFSAEEAQSGDQQVSRYGGRIEVEQVLPFGTRLAAGLSAARRDDDPLRDDLAAHEAGYGVTVTQPLLRGRGAGAQRARLRLARYDARMSRHALRAAAELLVAQVEQAAWDFVLAGRQIAIYEESLRLAEEQRTEVEERIRIGRLPHIELAAAAAEVAKRREDLINARALLAVRSLELLRLVGRPDGRWERAVRVVDEPEVPPDAADPVALHVQRALTGRPDLLEARLRVERGDVDLVRTRNGWLPRLDAFIALGRTGYADSFSSAFGGRESAEERFEAGVQLVYALGLRRERAAYERSLLGREQAAEALRNMEDLVQADVRAAHIEAHRTLEQIAATEATRRFREEAFRAESEKLRVGRSTSILVAQAQRDLVAARLAEVEAVVNCLKARLQLHWLDGSLLERRAIVFD